MSPERRDLTPYFLDLTRDYEKTFAPANLLSILKSHTIERERRSSPFSTWSRLDAERRKHG